MCIYFDFGRTERSITMCNLSRLEIDCIFDNNNNIVGMQFEYDIKFAVIEDNYFTNIKNTFNKIQTKEEDTYNTFSSVNKFCLELVVKF